METYVWHWNSPQCFQLRWRWLLMRRLTTQSSLTMTAMCWSTSEYKYWRGMMCTAQRADSTMTTASTHSRRRDCVAWWCATWTLCIVQALTVLQCSSTHPKDQENTLTRWADCRVRQFGNISIIGINENGLITTASCRVLSVHCVDYCIYYCVLRNCEITMCIVVDSLSTDTALYVQVTYIKYSINVKIWKIFKISTQS